MLVEQTRRITAEVVRMCPMFADQKANNRRDLLTREKPKNRHLRRDIWEARDWSYMPLTGLMIKQKIVTIRIVYGRVRVTGLNTGDFLR